MGLTMICTCSSEQFKGEELQLQEQQQQQQQQIDPFPSPHTNMSDEELASKSGLSVKTIQGEAKLDEGNIEEAESSLREALSLNYEEARALLGRLEYQRGNVEAALQVFDGIDISTVRSRMKSSSESRGSHRRGRSKNEFAQQPLSLHAAGLLLEAIYLKAKSLQKLGRLPEAAQECKSILDTIDFVFPMGVPSELGESKLQETISNAVELLPELWKLAGLYSEAMQAYRRALLHLWNLSAETSARIQKEFAILLLYCGVEAGAPSLASQGEGSFVPRNNLEEAILLLMILLRKSTLGRITWDPTVLEHLTFALSICGQTAVLAKQYEEILPGILSRADRWYNLALCYSGSGEKKIALNLLQKSLHPLEKPNDTSALLLAAKLSSEDCDTAGNAVEYAKRALANMGESHDQRSVVYHILGVSLGKQARTASSNSQRTLLQKEALKALQNSVLLDGEDAESYFDLGIEYAEQRNMPVALDCAKKYLELTGGSVVKGWRFLGLVLSSQQRYDDAENVLNVALEETGKWDQGELLRTKAKLQIAQGNSTEGIKTYMLLLALVQAHRKSLSAGTSRSKIGGIKITELEVWQDLAAVYANLALWHDAEVCLEKAQALKLHSAATWQAIGALHEARGQLQEASAAYNNALGIDPDYVPGKVSLGALLRRTGGKSLPVARSILTDALRLDPTNHKAWYNLGMVHKLAGRAAEAADCFQTAFVLEQSAPIEKFSSLS